MGITDFWFPGCSGRIVAKIRYPNNLFVKANGKQHFRDARRKRQDAFGRFGEVELPSGIIDECPRRNIRHERHAREYALLTSFHTRIPTVTCENSPNID